MKALISKLEKNSYVRSIALLALVLGAFITIGTFVRGIGGYLSEDVFVSRNISKQLEHLSAGQSIDYFKKYLGPQILQREVGAKMSESVFYYKGAYIQALVDKSNNEAVYWAVTYCEPLVLNRPVFSMGRYVAAKDVLKPGAGTTILAPRLILNKSTFTDFLKDERGELHEFISGATANSYAYEAVYLGNPSAYQTLLVGVNDICPSSSDLDDHLDADPMWLESGEKPTEDAIKRFREGVRINTYGETAPFMGEEVVKLLNAVHSDKLEEPYLNFGVDRIRVRYFPDR
ncbi:MAG: hypothetical protein Q7J45_01120 [bacterium]|nr:hypothetical protein [bacterium]